MFPRFVFALAFADLLLNLFFHQINRCVQIAFAIFGEQVRAADSQAHRTAELPLRDPHMIVLQCDPRVDHAGIQAIQFIELGEHVLLNGIRQRYVVRGEDQLHTDKMQSLFSIFNRQIPPVVQYSGGNYSYVREIAFDKELPLCRWYFFAEWNFFRFRPEFKKPARPCATTAFAVDSNEQISLNE